MKIPEIISFSDPVGENEEGLTSLSEALLKMGSIPQKYISSYTQHILSEYQFYKKNDAQKAHTLLITGISAENIIENIISKALMPYLEKQRETNSNPEGNTNDTLEECNYLLEKGELGTKDLQPTIQGIRRQMLYELAAQLDPREFFILTEAIPNTWDKIHVLETYQSKAVMRKDHGDDIEAYTEAFERIKQSGVNIPELLKPIAGDPDEGMSILPHKDQLITLKKAIDRHVISPKQILQHWLGMMSVVDRCKQAGVVLRDIKLENIEVDLAHEKLWIVDVETLFIEGTDQISSYTLGYELPEWGDVSQQEERLSTTHHEEMLYQMGVALGIIIDKVHSALSPEQIIQLTQLRRHLTRENPQQRIHAQAAMELIQDIMSGMLPE